MNLLVSPTEGPNGDLYTKYFLSVLTSDLEFKVMYSGQVLRDNDEKYFFSGDLGGWGGFFSS